MAYQTEQENFWSGDFGDQYIERNGNTREFVASAIGLFSRILCRTEGIHSVIEFGPNIGLNLKAIRLLLPHVGVAAVEINHKAVQQLRDDAFFERQIQVYEQSVLEYQPAETYDLALAAGVLIHIHPDALPQVYETLYRSSRKYICISEYYNPAPVEIPYRGHQGKLFKRDFAGEFLDRYPDCKLVDYGFQYHRDQNFPGDDRTWFLLEKQCRDCVRSMYNHGGYQMEDPGQQIYKIAEEIFPICRSITGNGVRKTLQILKKYIPQLQVTEVPSGTKAFDWEVPNEWNITEGYIEDSAGRRIIDFQNHNLHIMGYSVPVDAYVTLDELKRHIYTEPRQPDVIPYITSYYKENFGFCMSENQKNSLREDRYHMVIKSTLKPGSLTYAEAVIPGESKEEIFFSTYICHPSMANNECSGPALAAYLAGQLAQKQHRRYTLRFVFVPETIGSICYLSTHKDELKAHVIAGFNLSCVGDQDDYSIVESRYGNTLADRVLKNILRDSCGKYTTYSFLKRGSDERQYNAPGIDLPVVSFCRTKYGEYPQYHTSADHMDYISPEGFQGSYEVMCRVIEALEYNRNYEVQVLCEPQLGKRGLYPAVSRKGQYDKIYLMTTLIAYADGTNDLIAISDRMQCPMEILIAIVKKLTAHGLLQAKETDR